MADRNFKLRQMYGDFLELQRDFNANKKRFLKVQMMKGPPSNFSFANISEEDKKKWCLKKIVEEEEKEVFEQCEKSRPILINETIIAMNWYSPPQTQKSSVFIELKQQDEAMVEALKLLQIFSSIRLLESKTFHGDDIRVLNKYFTDDKELPNDRLISVLDYVLNQAIVYINGMAEKYIPKKDLKLKGFLQDHEKAKQTILEAFLRYPELIPEAWGRDKFLQKRKEAKKAEQKRKIEDVKEFMKTNEVEKEKEKDKETEREREKEKMKEKEKDKETDREREKEKEKGKEPEKPSEKVETPSKIQVLVKKPDPVVEKSESKPDQRTALARLRNLIKSEHRPGKDKDKDSQRKLKENQKNEKEKDKEKDKEKKAKVGKKKSTELNKQSSSKLKLKRSRSLLNAMMNN